MPSEISLGSKNKDLTLQSVLNSIKAMNIATQLLHLKKRLSDEIQKENSDNNIILSISNEIARLDESAVRFSVDAGIINRLGKELVGRHETAVSELVKNAFDADATEVSLIFENAWDAGGTLTIEDNGHGMTKEQLINGFMRLSSSDKIHNPISSKYQRRRAGKKGIGRFATQRLGEKLTIVTQTENSDSALKIVINWNEYETDKDLLSITNSIESISKLKNEGTILIIDNLRDWWTDAMIKRVYRYTSELLQPFPLSKKKKEEGEISLDPGFKSAYFRRDGEELISIVDEDEAIFKHALADIEGYVLADGQGCWSLKSEKLDFAEEVFAIGNSENRDETSAPFNLIKGVHFKAYYFIYDASLFAPGTFTFIRDLGYEKGGIKLYRNGFRVLPYGEQGDDWLNLDKTNNRNIVLAPHPNRNFFGFVELDDPKGNFEETSSREGLIENDYLTELITFVHRCLISAVIKVSDLRGRKSTASQKGYKRVEENPTVKVDKALEKMEEMFNSNDETEHTDGDDDYTQKERKERAKQIFEEIKQAREEEKKKNQLLIDENNMLRILAGLGLVIGEFVHEVQRFLPGFDADIKFLKEAVQEYREIYERTELLEVNVMSFTSYTSFFDRTISRNVIRDLEPIELRDVVRDFTKVIQNDLKRSNIILEDPLFSGYKLFTVPMHPSEWASILFNLYTNSKKAIFRKKTDGRILIACGRDSGNVYLEFSDNGDGISTENEENIFNAFFTTTSAANHSSNEAVSLVGTGLGLKILKDIIEFYNGDIYVATPTEGYSTTIRIEIPENITNN